MIKKKQTRILPYPWLSTRLICCDHCQPWRWSQQKRREFSHQNIQNDASELHKRQWTHQIILASTVPSLVRQPDTLKIMVVWIPSREQNMTFPRFYRCKWYGAAFLTDNVQQTLVCCEVYKSWNKHCLAGWGYRIHQQLLCRGERSLTDCPDMTLNDLIVRFQ